MNAVLGWVCSGLVGMGLLGLPAHGQSLPQEAAEQMRPAAQRSASDWLLHMHDAPLHHNYTGTLVVSSGAMLASSRVWHWCDGDDIVERVKSLSGTSRITFRRNQHVMTLLPESKRAITEIRDSLGLLNSRVSVTDRAVDQFYSARFLGDDRLAGLEVDVIQLEPRDKLRFAYKIWSEKKTGLIVRMETLNAQGYVMEQVGYTELVLDPPARQHRMSSRMAPPPGFVVESLAVAKTTPAAVGWAMPTPVPGFRSMSTYLRTAAAGEEGDTVQWTFSDGLASVSVFIDNFNPRWHKQEGLMISGATHTLVKRLKSQQGDWSLTVVGEVPVATLQSFAQRLVRVTPQPATGRKE